MNMTQGKSQALQKASDTKALQTFLQTNIAQIRNALPSHLKPERMMRLSMTCFSTQPALKNCTLRSILSSVVIASQLGLEIGIGGQGYLIPYGDTCTFVPGWQGLVGLLNNTGRATAWTNSVYEGDEWHFELGSNPHIKHVPGPNYGDVDKLVWVYACGKVNGSEQTVIEAWPKARVEKHRNKHNKVGQKHYSFANFEMYARKVVLLQVLKYMPKSIELSNAIVASNAAEEGKTCTVDAGTIIESEPGDIETTAEVTQETKEPEKKPEAQQQSTDKAKQAQQPAKSAPQQTPVPSPESANQSGEAEAQDAAADEAAAKEQKQPATPLEKPETTQVEPPEDAGQCVKMIEGFIARDGVTVDNTMRFLYGAGQADPKKHKALSELSTVKLQRIIVNWPNFIEKIKEMK